MRGKQQTISPGQIRMIWGIARKQGIEESVLRERVLKLSGQESIKALSASQAAQLIDGLMGKDEPSAARASPGQQAAIRSLAEQLGWDDPKRLRGWIRSRYGVERLEWLGHDKARSCIESLKAMLKAGRGERKQKQ